MALTERNRKLRERMLVPPSICVERCRYMTESYKQTEGESDVVRRAKAVSNILRKMTIHIDDGEVLAGNFTSKVRGGGVIPEIRGQWLLDEFDTLTTRETDRYAPLSDEEIRILKEDLPYWKGKAAYDKLLATMPDKHKKLIRTLYASPGYSFNGHHWAHSAANYATVLSIGCEGVIADAEAKIEALTYDDHRDIDRNQFWQATKVVHEGLMAFSERYAELAEKQAAECTDPKRRAELERLALTCRKVPRHPAESFYEAVQSCWITYCAVLIEGWGAGTTFGRIDQYLYPYYKKDKELGLITDAEVEELFQQMFIKMNGAINLQNYAVACDKGGHPIMNCVCIGGITEDGDDAVNELTYMFLDAEGDVGLSSEDIQVRINRKNSDRYVMKVLETCKKLGGKIKIISDESSIEALINEGIPLRKARDYISTGCHNPTVPHYARNSGSGNFNAGMTVELGLSDGYSRVLQKQIGLHTGDAKKFTDFEQVWDACMQQNYYGLGAMLRNKHADVKAEANYPCVLLSSLYDPCMEKGIDDYNGGCEPYMMFGASIIGAPNFADSMAAIKKIVFDDKAATMEDMCNALAANWEGYEWLLALVRKAPKFGNDDDYVDLLLRRYLNEMCDFTEGFRTVHGAKFHVGCHAMTTNVNFGAVTGATPDGRFAGEPMSEGGISPHQGRNISGMTATYNSVTKLDNGRIGHGTILNIRVAKAAMETVEKRRMTMKMLRTFLENGGNLVQFNFTDNFTLRAAQAEPEKYKDLLVRVATYSAYFVELGKNIQDDIISRNELE